MRIAFINPGYEHLGLEYLSAKLLESGHETQLFLDPILFDESGFIKQSLLAKWFSYEKHILRSLKDYNPGLICISILSDNYLWATHWASIIKKAFVVPIVVGGIHPSSMPERVIQEEHIDYICIGEGEEALVELASAIEFKKDNRHIKNIWCKQGPHFIKNEVRPLIKNIDQIPFPDKKLFYSVIPPLKRNYSTITSRGCPFTCSYCCNNVWQSIYYKENRIFRKRSIPNVINELMKAKKLYQPKHIVFLDEVFNADMPWLRDFLKEYQSKIDLPFSCYVFPDLLDKESIQLLKESGCIKLQMGVQMVDEKKRRELLTRQSSNTKITEAIRHCKRVGIYVTCDIIFGFPNLSEKELIKTIIFFSQATPDHIEIFWLRFYPKAAITDWAHSQGYLSDSDVLNINNGLTEGGIIKSNPSSTKLEKKVFILFYLLPLLPKGLKKSIVKNKLYNKIPTFIPLLLLYIFKRIFHRPKHEINTEQTIARYIHCMLTKFVLKCTHK